MATRESIRAPRLSEVKYDQSSPFHPFARQSRDGEWVVQPPESSCPVGLIRVRCNNNDGIEFVVYEWCDGAAATAPLGDPHPTLFHAVSWLRWHLQNSHATVA